jgi:hypothetical protein
MTSKLPAPAGHEQWYTAGRHTGITAKCEQRPERREKRKITAGRLDAARTVPGRLVIPL